MGRYLWNKLCKLLCIIFILWLILKQFGIDIIDWNLLEENVISAMPLVLMVGAIVYVITSVLRS